MKGEKMTKRENRTDKVSNNFPEKFVCIENFAICCLQIKSNCDQILFYLKVISETGVLMP